MPNIPERNYDELLYNPNDAEAPEIGTPQCLIEDGGSLIARGLFRLNEAKGPAAARDAAAAISSVLSEMHLDFYRRAEREKR